MSLPLGREFPTITAVSNVRTFYQLLSSDFVSWRGVSDGKYDVLTDAAFLFVFFLFLIYILSTGFLR